MAMNQVTVFKEVLQQPILVSLFDYSGCWSAPYRKAGYRVLQVEKKLGFDLYKWDYKQIRQGLVGGILAAPPCTDFATSGAQYWKRKDIDGRTKESVQLVKKILEVVKYFRPRFWVIENPVGRLNDLVPELKSYGPWYWQPYWFGDRWTKKTGLWGVFKKPSVQHKTLLVRYSKQGSWIQMLGGKSETTKELRSITPPGFAQSFFDANPLETKTVSSKSRQLPIAA
ncbi:DNA cytosine methyltransferase [Longitalea luteola]|uniref:DNA cytosine methyltransferase n=1 Tax=Longitalea luteola TaxID=2812563 RepID=UPI001A95F31D|nr:DNA cytosine methyltransferase [Longitalea luteola]